MRLVLDTNAAISALLWLGTPGKLIEAAQLGTVSLFTSAPLLAELRAVLLREKFAKQLRLRNLSPGEVADGYGALAAQADLIVSGDTRVLNLKSHLGIPILAVAEAAKGLPQR